MFGYNDTWVEPLKYIAWVISVFYHCTIEATPGQAVFGRDMILNLASVVYWQVIPAKKHQQVDIYNVRENNRRGMHDYAIGDILYVEMTGI